MTDISRINKIADFYKKRKRMPSYSEIMKIAGFKSKNSAFRLANKMISLGIADKDTGGNLVPLRIFGEVRVLGTVEAGFPSPAEEELADAMSLDDYLITNKEATFLLKVNGDSMTDAGILPGDMALVERGPQPKDGEIVIAEVDNEWTIKYFKRRGNKIFLEAANKKYKTIVPETKLTIAAVVKAIIRKY